MSYAFTGCGGLLHTDRGVLNSPRYPQSYLPAQTCSWHVMVTPGFRISLTFQSPFQVQGYGTHCSTGDYLEVLCLRFDGIKWGEGILTDSSLTQYSFYFDLLTSGSVFLFLGTGQEWPR